MKDHVKRVFDLIISLILMALLSPLFLLVIILNLIILGRPIFFKQERIGKSEQPFYIFKFRTMLNTYNENGELLSDQERMTSYGKLLRRYSLDELPELFNVLLGEMSLVGPRPLLPEYLDFYTLEQKRRHQVKPGITGLAQVNGRNAISWEEKLKLDVFYVDNRSFLLDLKILMITLKKVINAEGISQAGHATMPRFDKHGN